MIENCISNFLNNVFCPNTDNSNTENITYIKLPYYGHLSFEIRKRLSKLFKQYYPDATFRFIFTNSYTIKSYFPYKDRVPVKLIPNIIYQYTCSMCNHRYIGETKRNLSLRIAEHKGISPRTGHAITHPNFSQIRLHCQNMGHEICDNNFKILMKANHPEDTKILESLFIHDLKPEMNNQSTSYPLTIL